MATGRGYISHDEYVSPRDQYITIYGRMPVLEALNDPSLDVAKLVVADNANGRSADDILRTAEWRGIPVERATPGRIKLLAGNGKHDQGIVADVRAPQMMPLHKFIARRGTRPTRAFLLDGVTNPGNVGMIIRSATGAGLDGVILPRQGTPHVGPLVIKASAGVAFRAPIVNAVSADQAVTELRGAGYQIYGLSARSRSSLFRADLARRSVFVLGGETNGVSVATDADLSIPMHRGVESLNVAVAAAVVAFEIANRRPAGGLARRLAYCGRESRPRCGDVHGRLSRHSPAAATGSRQSTPATWRPISPMSGTMISSAGGPRRPGLPGLFRSRGTASARGVMPAAGGRRRIPVPRSPGSWPRAAARSPRRRPSPWPPGRPRPRP